MPKTSISAPAVFCILIFFAFPVCVSYQLMDPFITPRVILISAAAFVFCFVALFWKDDGRLKSVPVYSLLAFLLLTAISIFRSLNPGDAWFEWMKTFLGLPV